MAMNAPLPQHFGRYVLRERIAAGGMAEVFRAGLPGFGGFEREVAIKRMFRHLADDPVFVEMVADEAKIASQLSHPNIASILDFGREGQDWFLAYELVAGVDLFRMLQRQFELGRDLPIDLAIFVIAELASALDFAHARKTADGAPMQIIHRDVSPQNVLVGFQGEVKLTDFGIAKAAARATQTTAGQVKGKIYYMSPEQARGEALDHRSDLFSAGILLYELLCTRPLYEEGDQNQLLDAVGRAQVRWPADKVARIPAPLVALCEQALARRPDARFQTGRAMREALLRVADTIGERADREALGVWVRRLFGVADDRPPQPQPARPKRKTHRHWASASGQNPAATVAPQPPASAAPAPTHPARPGAQASKGAPSPALPRTGRSATFEAPRHPQAAAEAAAAAFDDDERTSMIDTEAILRRIDGEPPPLPTVAATLPSGDAPPPVPSPAAARPASATAPPPVPTARPPQRGAPAPTLPAATELPSPPQRPQRPPSRLLRASGAAASSQPPPIPAAASAAPAPEPAAKAPSPPPMRPPRTLVDASAGAATAPKPGLPVGAAPPRSEAATRFVAAMPDDDPPSAGASAAADAPRPEPPPRPLFRHPDEPPASWALIAATLVVWSGVLTLCVYALKLLVR